MNTIEDFENAPLGATATSPNGDIALNTGRYAFDWAIYNSSGRFYDLLRCGEMKGFTLDPATSTPTREQLADTIYDALEDGGWVSTTGYYPYEVADAVLELLKGQTDD